MYNARKILEKPETGHTTRLTINNKRQSIYIDIHLLPEYNLYRCAHKVSLEREKLTARRSHTWHRQLILRRRAKIDQRGVFCNVK